MITIRFRAGYIDEMITIADSSRTQTRDSTHQDLLLPGVRNTRIMSMSSAVFWNSFPFCVRYCPSVTSFRRACFKASLLG